MTALKYSSNSAYFPPNLSAKEIQSQSIFKFKSGGVGVTEQLGKTDDF